MNIIGTYKLDVFKRKHVDVYSQVDSWFAEVEAAAWQTSLDIKERYASASFLANNIVIFNLKGNKYRLKVRVSYKNQIVLIDKIDTHDKYNNW